jgi:Na+/phosphate symporter
LNSEVAADRERSLLRLRHWIFVILGGIAVALLPWTAYLSFTLPSQHRSAHWDIVWPGLDVGIALAIAGTVFALVRCSAYLPIVATVAGTLLLCDAWFDTLTSNAGNELAMATFEAVAAEVPLALFCFWLAVDAESLAAARRFVGRPQPSR